MGRTREFDVDNALRIAADLFWREGYEGASIGKLTKSIGITAPSLYFAFGSKEALFERVVGSYRELQADLVEAALRQKTAKQVVESLLYGYIDLVTQPGRAAGCLILNSSLPVVDDHPFRRRFAEQRKSFRKTLRKRFGQALQDKDKLPAGSDSAALAHLVVVLIWGLAVEAQSGAKKRELREAVSVAMRIFPA